MTEPKKQCAREGCDRPVSARGVCNTHYAHLRKTSGLIKVRESAATWYCDDCSTGQRPGSYPCRLCCGYTGRREQVSEAAQAPS